MTESTPAPEDFLGNPEPAIWAEVERYATQSNDEYAAALLSLRARVEQLEANAKPTPKFDQIRSSDITPPPELVEEWANDSVPRRADAIGRDWEIAFATRAAQWGADAELEACVEWISKQSKIWTSDQLRAARRPKPPSPKEQALIGLSRIEQTGEFFSDGMKDTEMERLPALAEQALILDTLRLALEQLDD